jgi:hypothetical protein
MDQFHNMNLSTSGRQIFRVGSKGMQVSKINLT